MGGKVSVLIPARNEEDNLERCLESLLVQTYSNYEVVVLDDQSTDRTWSEYANGDYLLFTDADTVHSKESIAWAVTNIESHGVDCLSGYVSQELNTFEEVLIVPATYIMTTMILPLWLIAATKVVCVTSIFKSINRRYNNKGAFPTSLLVLRLTPHS